ncbi:translation initiation factor IF-3 [soil metagenome]
MEGNEISAEKSLRLNEEITSKEVRLIGADGQQVGIVTLTDALEMAEKATLDLVEISSASDPPVCRIMNYGKFLFQQRKKAAVAKKNQKLMQVKELKYRPGIEDGDYKVKLRRLIEFLEHGDKVKITLRFRGREVTHNDLGLKLLDKLQVDLANYGVIEQQPKFEGRQLIMVIAPKKI